MEQRSDTLASGASCSDVRWYFGGSHAAEPYSRIASSQAELAAFACGSGVAVAGSSCRASAAQKSRSGTVAARNTLSTTLPSSALESELRACVRITIRSMPDRAASRMANAAWSCVTSRTSAAAPTLDRAARRTRTEQRQARWVASAHVRALTGEYRPQLFMCHLRPQAGPPGAAVHRCESSDTSQ